MSRSDSSMRCLVTGCAGFIGSHLCDRLLSDGHEVIGIDAFSDSYPRVEKEHNLEAALQSPSFTLYNSDLLITDLESILGGVDVVFHLAGQTGVRSSWGHEFELYTERNIRATQHLLEACRGRASVQRLVYASSSSVYGNAARLPVSEDAPTIPISPYGVTKLAAEHLCRLYCANFGVPIVILRYFTVYGARQRPDMAFHRFIRAALGGEPITVYEDGRQTRDFTHVRDIVQATVLAAQRPDVNGETYNIAGGSQVPLHDAIDLIGEVVGTSIQVASQPGQAGDARHTCADTVRARAELGYAPLTGLRDGLCDEVAWLREAGAEAPFVPARLANTRAV